MPWYICTPSLIMIPFFVFQLWRKMLIFYLYMNIEGRLWDHPVTSWMTSSPWKNTFSCIIWDDLFISDIKLKLHVIFWHFQNGRYFYVTANFLYRKRYRKLTIAEQCPTINPAFFYFFIILFFRGGGGHRHWHWWRDVGAHVQKFNLDDTLFLQ